jgi:hypothetical protein
MTFARGDVIRDLLDSVPPVCGFHPCCLRAHVHPESFPVCFPRRQVIAVPEEDPNQSAALLNIALWWRVRVVLVDDKAR